MRVIAIALIALLAVSISALTPRQTSFRSSLLQASQGFSPIRIIRAAYGPADVTEKVKTLAEGKSEVTIAAENSNFGDPWYGTQKSLTVVYQVGFGPVLTAVAREHQSVHLGSPVSDNSLKILGATYGNLDVTEKVQSLVKDNALTVAAENSVFSDPWYGVVKTLAIVYQYGNQEPKIVIVKEHQTARIAP